MSDLVGSIGRTPLFYCDCYFAKVMFNDVWLMKEYGEGGYWTRTSGLEFSVLEAFNVFQELQEGFNGGVSYGSYLSY